jgi:hypothetical protein
MNLKSAGCPVGFTVGSGGAGVGMVGGGGNVGIVASVAAGAAHPDNITAMHTNIKPRVRDIE